MHKALTMVPHFCWMVPKASQCMPWFLGLFSSLYHTVENVSVHENLLPYLVGGRENSAVYINMQGFTLKQHPNDDPQLKIEI